MVRNMTGDEMESLCRFSGTMGSLLSICLIFLVNIKKIIYIRHWVKMRIKCRKASKYSLASVSFKACFLTFRLLIFILSSQNHFTSLHFPNNLTLIPFCSLLLLLLFVIFFFPAIIFLILLLIFTETFLFQLLSFYCYLSNLNIPVFP